jgi:hypothetical protein
MTRILAGNCTPILDGSKDTGKTEVDTTFEEMVLGAVQVLCEFPLLVCKRNHSDQCLKAFDDTLKQFGQMKSIFRAQKILKSASAKT